VQRRGHRGVVRPLVAPHEHGGLGRVGRAAEEAQERELVDGAKLVGAAAELVGERDRQRARAQRVAERLAGAEVGGERDRAQDLGEAERAGLRGADDPRTLARPRPARQRGCGTIRM
jgi:hypothetical protein